MSKISIRFFNDRMVRAAWDEENSKWWFSVLDIVGAINEQDDYEKSRNYWKYLKARLKKEGHQLGSDTTRLRLTAPDGKKRLTNVLDSEGVAELAKHFPNAKATQFLDWFVYSDNTLDGQSRTKNISKGGFTFANCIHLPETLKHIERMPETTFDEIADKYVEMNVAHPFMEGNGRSTRIWLDLMLKRSLKRCVDWSLIDKNDYLNAMRESVADSARIKALIRHALTTKINDREMFMKGIDYSYYYEQEE